MYKKNDCLVFRVQENFDPKHLLRTTLPNIFRISSRMYLHFCEIFFSQIS